jgi:hypothetical protein
MEGTPLGPRAELRAKRSFAKSAQSERLRRRRTHFSVHSVISVF